MDFLKSVLTSKKAIAALAAIAAVLLVPVLAKVGLVLSEDQIEHFVAVVAAYLVGQGIADHGKEKAKVEVAEREKLG